MAGFEGEQFLARGAAFNASRPYPVIAGGAPVAYRELALELSDGKVVAVENTVTPELWNLTLKVVREKVREVNAQMNLDNISEDTRIIDDLGLQSVHRTDLMSRLKNNWRASGRNIKPPTGLQRTIRTLGHIIEVVNLTELRDDAAANQYRLNRMKQIEATESDYKANHYPEVEFD